MTIVHVSGVLADSALEALIIPIPTGISTFEVSELADSFVEAHFTEELTNEQITNITTIIQNHSANVTETICQAATVEIKAAMGIDW